MSSCSQSKQKSPGRLLPGGGAECLYCQGTGFRLLATRFSLIRSEPSPFVNRGKLTVWVLAESLRICVSVLDFRAQMQPRVQGSVRQELIIDQLTLTSWRFRANRVFSWKRWFQKCCAEADTEEAASGSLTLLPQKWDPILQPVPARISLFQIKRKS